MPARAAASAVSLSLGETYTYTSEAIRARAVADMSVCLLALQLVYDLGLSQELQDIGGPEPAEIPGIIAGITERLEIMRAGAIIPPPPAVETLAQMVADNWTPVERPAKKHKSNGVKQKSNGVVDCDEGEGEDV